MTAITPDRSDESRCVSVHWSLPVQCVLPRAHRENWHEAWHPKSGNRMRYRHTIGATEQLANGAWTSLEIPPPGGYCNEQYSGNPKAFCDDSAGHREMHRVVYDGCTYTWGGEPSRPVSAEQLTEDVRTLRARVVELEAERHTTNEALDEVVKAVRAKSERIAELETVGVQARAALGALCYDLADPGSNALGALYLLQQVTVWTDGKPDDGERALAKHDAQVLRQAAESLEGADRDDDAVNFLYLLADQVAQGTEVTP